MGTKLLAGALLAGTASLWLNSVFAHSITVEPAPAVRASFDIIETTIVTRNGTAVFTTRVRGTAGADKPGATGTFAGSDVYAYVWPTSLDSGDIGFDRGQGIVALAVTFHPDFDDAAYGGKNRDVWHPHWVVLNKDAACKGGLKVTDIPKDAKPKVPPTWPGVPLLIDSPDYPTSFTGGTVEVGRVVAQLVTQTDAELLKLRSFGRTSLREVRRKLQELGLDLGMSLPEGFKPHEVSA